MRHGAKFCWYASGKYAWRVTHTPQPDPDAKGTACGVSEQEAAVCEHVVLPRLAGLGKAERENGILDNAWETSPVRERLANKQAPWIREVVMETVCKHSSTKSPGTHTDTYSPKYTQLE